MYIHIYIYIIYIYIYIYDIYIYDIYMIYIYMIYIYIIYIYHIYIIYIYISYIYIYHIYIYIIYIYHIYIYIIYIYHIYMIYIYMIYIYMIYMRMGTRLQYDLCSHVYSHYPSTAKGVATAAPLARVSLQVPRENNRQCRSCASSFVVVVENRSFLYQQRTHTYRRESPIHRLSAVGLLRSLRAGSRGPYR